MNQEEKFEIVIKVVRWLGNEVMFGSYPLNTENLLLAVKRARKALHDVGERSDGIFYEEDDWSSGQ